MAIRTASNTGSRDIMTVAQVAEYLQLNKLTIYKYIREGKLPAVKLGRTFRVLREDVHWFLDAQRIAPAEKAAPPRRVRPVPKAAAAQPAREAQETQEVYRDPRHPDFGQPRETMITNNPLDWVIRGLH